MGGQRHAMHARRRADLILVVEQRRDDGGGHQLLIIGLQPFEAQWLRLQLLDLPQRLLLLLPTTTYRTAAFVEVARRIGVELTVASEQPSTLEAANPAGLLTLDFAEPERAADAVAAFARQHPIDGVVGVDDETAIVAAAIAQRLGLTGNPVAAAVAARDKHRQRELLARAGVPIPRFMLRGLDEDPAEIAKRITYPCVLKPLRLSASRGVIRADNVAGFVEAHARLKTIVCEPGAGFLIEEFIPGSEVALELRWLGYRPLTRVVPVGERAVRIAREAFDSGEWSRRPGKDRARVLLKLADLGKAIVDETAVVSLMWANNESD